MTCQQILLPWPAKALSPNARGHWSQKSRAAKAYRMQCFLFAKKAGLVAPAGRILLQLEFLPPTARRRDDDNLLASFKAGRDGLADALGIDDSLFVSQVQIGEVHPGGAVRVTLSPFQSGAQQ
ncbi:endodeoxyribonuclease RusA [Pseudomonas sp. LMG 31766]|uniref:Endodeoxyribonuclease RusA n=1 Tax=Pseudomonas chaetocerotis TaxID=2758695 RepID=A0A931GAE9_9PSED|nr:endodeoxyribonuclease RusA [Pseudomonas chaetocerotis]MBZ9665759.1 endodeoxyribonuclease RusA [Pseudomonas chaetocerotis]